MSREGPGEPNGGNGPQPTGEGPQLAPGLWLAIAVTTMVILVLLASLLLQCLR
ncbi:MAG: hypothetical protein HPY83_18055 [Anaerolineae bacterium]|nr:hypothetical protein [Anaerolineae bacterium]